jgi:hypothetical protein
MAAGSMADFLLPHASIEEVSHSLMTFIICHIWHNVKLSICISSHTQSQNQSLI